jgi:hypothetical protein
MLGKEKSLSTVPDHCPGFIFSATVDVDSSEELK